MTASRSMSRAVVTVTYMTRSADAVCVRANGAPSVWIPLALCRLTPENPAAGELVRLAAPAHVLDRKGLRDAAPRGPDLFGGKAP